MGNIQKLLSKVYCFKRIHTLQSLCFYHCESIDLIVKFFFKSEYLAEHDFRVKFLTGFTGSNAYVAVTNQKAVLWTDGRYFTQVYV